MWFKGGSRMIFNFSINENLSMLEFYTTIKNQRNFVVDTDLMKKFIKNIRDYANQSNETSKVNFEYFCKNCSNGNCRDCIDINPIVENFTLCSCKGAYHESQ